MLNSQNQQNLNVRISMLLCYPEPNNFFFLQTHRNVLITLKALKIRFSQTYRYKEFMIKTGEHE